MTLIGCLAPSILFASISSQDGQDASAFCSGKATSPSNPTQLQSKDTALNAVNALTRNTRTSAGVEMDPKSVAPGTTASPQVCEWFKKPAIYSDYGFNSSRDRREKSLDSEMHQVTFGGDFETIAAITVGAMYTFVYDHASTRNNSTLVHRQSDAHLWSAYAGKNFMEWINVGGSFTYSKSAADLSEFAGGIPSLDRYVDSYAAAVFVGASHTWGAWQVASTPTLIYQYDRYDFTASGSTPGALNPYDLDTTTFTWLNTVDYSITEKFQVGALLHWTHLVNQSHDPSPGLTRNDRSWITPGVRFTYFPIENLQATVSYETDLLNAFYENHRLRCGITYSF